MKRAVHNLETVAAWVYVKGTASAVPKAVPKEIAARSAFHAHFRVPGLSRSHLPLDRLDPLFHL